MRFYQVINRFTKSPTRSYIYKVMVIPGLGFVNVLWTERRDEARVFTVQEVIELIPQIAKRHAITLHMDND